MAIQVEDLCYTYGEGTALERQALKHVSFEIQDGEFVGLIGHTGSGKSTLIQHLNGLIKPTSGDIKYQGVSIYSQGYKLKDLRSKVGLVFQYPEYQLFEADIFTDVCFGPKNLGLPQEEVEKRARHALKLVGMDEKFYKQSPFELSGGQKRRVAIAGVLAMRLWKIPSVLLSPGEGTTSEPHTAPAARGGHVPRRQPLVHHTWYLPPAAFHAQQTARGSDDDARCGDGFPPESALLHLPVLFLLISDIPIPPASHRQPTYPQSGWYSFSRLSTDNPRTYPHYPQVFHIPQPDRFSPVFRPVPDGSSALPPSGSWHTPSRRAPACPAGG